jgi:DNA-binding beta-propeller fold protein YncE
LAVDASGNVYMTDYLNSHVQKFDSSGNFICEWGSEGTGDGSFTYPTGIAVDTSGNVYVVDTYNYRIQKFKATGVACPSTYLLGGKDQRLATIRKFRDKVLVKTLAGEKLVETYYREGERIVAVFAERPTIKILAKKVLESLVPAMELLLRATD